MRYTPRTTLFLALGFMLSSPVAHAMDTRQRLADFGQGLKEVVRKNDLPSQKIVREALVLDMGATFADEIRTLKPPDGYTMAKAATSYLDSLEEGLKLFPEADMRTERDLFMKAAHDTYRHEMHCTEDYKKERTLQEAYDMLLNNCKEGMKRFAEARYADARQGMLTTFNSIFSELIGSATTQFNVDLAQQMADNVNKAHAAFPTNTDDLANKNGPVVYILESAAKRIQQKARTDRKANNWDDEKRKN